jgi:hypothetical protein
MHYIYTIIILFNNIDFYNIIILFSNLDYGTSPIIVKGDSSYSQKMRFVNAFLQGGSQ